MKQDPEYKKRRMATHARILRGGAEGDAASERAGTDRYEFYDSDGESFDKFFADVLIPYGSIRDYLEAHYSAKRGEAVGIEFGGSARKLFRELNRDALFHKTVGFVLNDKRTEAERLEDSGRHHDIVEADVFFNDGAEGLSWRTVEAWVRDNGKPDIIIERMVQGIDLVRKADLYVAIVKRWLSQLSEGGTLLAEIPKLMPREEREKVSMLLQDLDVQEVVFNRDLTSMLIRTL